MINRARVTIESDSSTQARYIGRLKGNFCTMQSLQHRKRGPSRNRKNVMDDVNSIFGNVMVCFHESRHSKQIVVSVILYRIIHGRSLEFLKSIRADRKIPYRFRERQKISFLNVEALICDHRHNDFYSKSFYGDW